MAWLDDFADEMVRSISVFPKQQSFDTEGRTIEGFSPVASYIDLAAAVWFGTTAESLVSDRYKGKIDAVAVLYPGPEIPTGSKIVIDNESVFYSTPSDDIMSLGDVLLVGLQNGV